jgi:signal transduction histidine kinase
VPKYLGAKIGLWLGSAFILVAIFGIDLLGDIDGLHREASLIEASNKQSHDLHALEMGLYACIAPIKEFLISGDYRMGERFSRQSGQLLASIRDYQSHNNDEAAASLARAMERVRPKAEAIFKLPFPVGNMEGPILLREIEMEIRQATERLSQKHRDLDAQVNEAMHMLAGLRLNMRSETMIMLAGLLLVLSLLTLFMYRRVIRPLVHMRGAVQKVSTGDFDVQCHVESMDELGELATAFNGMAKALKDRENMLDRARSMAAHQEKMHALGMMAAGIAHEVGNPLSAISVSLQVAKRKLATGDLHSMDKQLSIAMQETERTEQTIRQVLDYGRQDDHQLRQAFDVASVIHGAMNLARMSPRRNKTRLTAEIPENLPKVWGSDSMLMQVLVNLLLNALDACDARGKVRIRAFVHHDGVAIEVHDNGPGIPPELQDEIFKPLFTTKRRGTGTGLGLAISQELTTRMGGHLSLVGSDDRGSCFRVWLPAHEKDAKK